MADVTVSQFAEVLKVPVDRLLTQLDEAGIKVAGATDLISDEAKMELLTFLRRSHGRDDNAASPSKITLKRKSQGEIKVATSQGRARTVNVEVRTKKTYLNRSVLEEKARQHNEELDRQRERDDPALRAEAERREKEKDEAEQREREVQAAEFLRRQEEEIRAQAEMAARTHAEERERSDTERKQAEQQVRDERAAREREREAQKTARTSTTTAVKEPGKRTELHMSEESSERFKKKKQQQAQSKSRRGAPSQVSVASQHGFEKPVSPVKREVAIPETITVAELAQRMAVKATEVIKVMMNMGVMATINQPIDQDTATLVVEELGHTAVAHKESALDEELHGTEEQQNAVASASGHSHGTC